MVINNFPPVNLADKSGLLAIGGDLETQTILNAYRSGIFVWPPASGELAWFAPDPRTILILNDFKLSKRDQRFIKNKKFKCLINQDFEEIIKNCSNSKNRRNQTGIWINSDIINAYTKLHYAGFVHSIGVYLEHKLVGGLYGISINGMFAGESMFYKESGASKAALSFLVNYLKDRECKWIDCQIMTPLFASIGAKSIPRSDFMELLEQSLKQKIKLF